MKGIIYLMKLAHINNMRIVIEKDGMIYFRSNFRELSLSYETIEIMNKKDLENTINRFWKKGECYEED